MTNKWQPMNTAPRDGTVILLLTKCDTFGDQINTGFWGVKSSLEDKAKNNYEWCSNGCIDDYLTFCPDMWHPLPELPEQTKKEKYMYKYRSKATIEAFKWTGDHDQEGEPDWIVEMLKNQTASFDEQTRQLIITCPITQMIRTASFGFYIIKTESGAIYVKQPLIFEADFERVND